MMIDTNESGLRQRLDAGTLGRLCARIKQTVHEIEPGAEVILYGSRARGDAEAESDWDLLILVEGVVDAIREQAIRHRLYELEWDSNEVLSSVICCRDDWSSPLYQAMPFHQNVARDGIAL